MGEVNIELYNERPAVTSREVAEKFDKRHDHVMRDIRNIIKELGSPQNWGHLFVDSTYENKQNKQVYSQYLITRDGFTLLTMGFTGAKALEWKLKYIEAFNKMEAELKKQSEQSLPGTYKEALIQLLEQVERNEQLVEERVVLLPKADYHDDVLNKDGLITTTTIAKDLGLKSAAKLNQVLYLNRIIYKNGDGWCPYADYEWLVTDGYCDYQSYKDPNAKPYLKWTEKGRKWILENYATWKDKVELEMVG